MKKIIQAIHIAGLLSTVMLADTLTLAQPLAGPRISPLTGLPETSPATRSGINPATGISQAGSGERTPFTAVMDASQLASKVQSLIFDGAYEEALKDYLTYHEQYRSSSSWSLLLPNWIELGRRYPKARQALVDIRDHDLQEFAEGRGFSELFAEINSINGALHQDDSTYDLFKSFRDKDPDLGQQCSQYVEDLLFAKGDYKWCYDHMGDPQARFDSLRESFNRQIEQQKRMADMNEAARLHIAELNRQRGWTNNPAYSPPDAAAMTRRWTQDGFVSETRRIIEILVATDHKTDAESIQDQALTVLDNARLKSAVRDAEAKLKAKN